MQVMNEWMLTMQSVNTQSGQTSRSADSDRADTSQFEKLLRQRNERPSQDSGTEAKSALETGETTQPAVQAHDPLRELAAAMTIQPFSVPQMQIQQTQEPAAGLEILSEQTVQLTQPLVEVPVETPAETGAQNGMAQLSPEPAIMQQPQTPMDSVSAEPQTAEPFAQTVTVDAPQQQTQEPAAPNQNQPVAAEQAPAQTVESQAGQEGSAAGQDSGNDDAQLQHGPAESKPLFRDVESTPVKVGEPTAPETRPANVETQVSDQIGKALESGSQRVEIQLTPANLGTVEIQLTRSADGSLEVVLRASSEKTANLLSQHAERLGALLQSSTMSTVQVAVERQEQSQQFQQQQDGQHPQQQQQQQQHRQHGEDFLQQLRLGLITLDEQAS